MSTREEEPTVIGRADPEQIRQAKAAAAVQDLADIEARHAEVEARVGEIGYRPTPAHADRGWLLAALREAQAEVERLRPIVEAIGYGGLVYCYDSGGAGRATDQALCGREQPEALTGARDMVRCPACLKALLLRPAGTPPDLTSLQTFEITGRGTIKVIHPDALPKGYVLKVGDPVRIDGQDWRCVGIESHRHKDGSIGVLVRPAGTLASIPPDECDGANR